MMDRMDRMLNRDSGWYVFLAASFVFKLLLPVAAIVALLFMLMGASYRTPNFIVETQSPQLAEEFGSRAENVVAGVPPAVIAGFKEGGTLK